VGDIFRKKFNGTEVIEDIGPAWLWTLLFGCFYFAYKEIWKHFIISLLAGMCTAGFSWLVYPFFAKNIVRTHYTKKGWEQISD